MQIDNNRGSGIVTVNPFFSWSFYFRKFCERLNNTKIIAGEASFLLRSLALNFAIYVIGSEKTTIMAHGCIIE